MQHQGSVSMVLFPLEMVDFLFLQQLSGAKNQVKQLLLQLVSTLVNMWGIQSAVELGRDLKIEKMTGTVIIVKVVAREELENRHGSLCRATGENLNRLFPGKKEGTTYEKLAYAVVEELQKVADFYIDLHSGDDYEKLDSLCVLCR